MKSYSAPGRTAERLKGYLASYAQKYPLAWRQFDDFRDAKGTELPSWPDWCWCPLAGAYAIITRGSSTIPTPNDMADVGPLGALAAWRITQGIYRFDSDLFQALWETPLEDKLPVDVLYQLPEWCIYIEHPKPQGDLLGWFVHLEHDISTGRPELRLVLDREQLIPVVIHLTHDTLDDCVMGAVQEAQRQASLANIMPSSIPLNIVAPLAQHLAPMVSVLLYLCSLAADIADLRGKRDKPGNPVPRPIKKGKAMRAFPNPQTTWLVGHRIGASLRLARPKEKGEPQGGTHASPRPHIRRAHWHAYWTGPRKEPSKRKLILKWLPPTPVGTGDLVPTIRPVEGSADRDLGQKKKNLPRESSRER